MLIYKCDLLPRLTKITGYYANKDVAKYSHTAITETYNPQGAWVTMPWGRQQKWPLNSYSVKNKLSKADVDFIASLLMLRINQLATHGGGSFGPYRVLPAENRKSFISIKKKPAAKTRKEAISRMKELVYLVYGLTLQDEIEAGIHTKEYRNSNGDYVYTHIRVWGVNLPHVSPGISLLRWGTSITMRLGKTLSVILGLMMNPYSDYVDLKDYMYSSDFYYSTFARAEFRDKLPHIPLVRDFYKYRRIAHQNDKGFMDSTKIVYRTNLKTGVPDKLEVKRSYWFDCFDGPELPEFHFRIEYAKKFSLQYSPEEKNKWILHMPN